MWWINICARSLGPVGISARIALRFTIRPSRLHRLNSSSIRGSSIYLGRILGMAIGVFERCWPKRDGTSAGDRSREIGFLFQKHLDQININVRRIPFLLIRYYQNNQNQKLTYLVEDKFIAVESQSSSI